EQANLSEAKLEETAFPRTILRGADLTGCDLSSTILDGARYDQQTRWPVGFDPVAAGAKLE
ncbi:MAG TPA: pentapeptide repeat-containing protein, partial [Streptosporangiaceae bacterium]|nr:pentapeptide repeat-containing protein [Streptosporangiaceae bacterium]